MQFSEQRREDTAFLRRTIELARLASSRTSPNPKVGAVVVHNGRIIGEGYHHAAGQPHAEPLAVNNVVDHSILKNSTLYVSLEPCNHFGKTPPCTDLVLKHAIPRVVVGSLDPNPIVAGSGLKRLVENGVEVAVASDPTPFVLLNKGFWMSQLEKRPWVTLKWAQTANGVMGKTGERLHITAAQANRLVHRLRAEHPAILIGRGTAQADQPSLTTRLHPGSDPLRLVMDSNLELDTNQPPFSISGRTVLITQAIDTEKTADKLFVKSTSDMKSVLERIYDAHRVTSIFVEGGSNLHTSFLNAELADELYVLTSSKTARGNVNAPMIPDHYELHASYTLGSDQLSVYRNPVSISRILTPVAKL